VNKLVPATSLLWAL